MPRQSRGRAAPSRHAAPAPASQSRQASTSNVPARNQVPPPQVAAQQTRGTGMMGNILGTAAGVGIGSAIGHSIGSLFTGGSSQPEAQQQQQQQVPSAFDSYDSQAQQQQQAYGGISCESDAKQFTKCLEATSNDMSACSYYLDALKQCQAMARSS